MEIVKIAAIGIITAVCVIILKDNKSDVAVLVGIIGGILIILSVTDYFADIFGVLKAISDKAGIPSELIKIIMKIIGIGYITDFAAGLIEDSGQRSLSEKVILAGKLIIMAISLPIITMLFDTVAGLMEW